MRHGRLEALKWNRSGAAEMHPTVFFFGAHVKENDFFAFPALVPFARKGPPGKRLKMYISAVSPLPGSPVCTSCYCTCQTQANYCHSFPGCPTKKSDHFEQRLNSKGANIIQPLAATAADM